METATVNLEKLVGKYLTFKLGGEKYGVPITLVKEIIGMLDITPVPQTPKHVKGVVNLRGKIIPVIDLSIRLGIGEREYTRETCIIVLELQELMMGVIVDSVDEVVDFELDPLQHPPQLGLSLDSQFIMAMAKAEDDVVILMDIEKMLKTKETELLKSLADT